MTTVGLHESSQIAKYEYIFGSQRDIVIISTEQEMKKKQDMKRKQEGEFSTSRINKKRQVMT